MTGEAALAIDVGTGGVKCLLFSPKGLVLYKQTTPLRFRFEGGGTDFDPAEAWRGICAMTREARSRAAKIGVKIVSVAPTSMREGNVFYDREGNELLAVPNIDTRAASEAREIAGKLGDLVYEKSGHWPNAIFLASRLRWMSRKGGARLRRVRKVSMINDWIIYRLTGTLLTEPTNGCETALFDIRKRTWSDELVKELGVADGLLPGVADCGTLVGTLSREASEKTTLPKSVAVVVGAADTEAALLGCGTLDSGKVAAVAGTTTPVQAVVDSPLIDVQRRVWTCCHVVPGRWLVESNAGATGMLFDWWARTTRSTYAELDLGAAKIPPGSNGVRVSMGSALFNARGFPPIRTRIENVGPWTETFAVAKAVIEGTCFAVRANLEQVKRITKEHYGEVTFCGGAAKSDLWSRVQADVLGLRLVRHKMGDATAKGAAMLSFVALKHYRSLSEASARMTGGRVLVEPDEGSATDYGPLYDSWLRDIVPASRTFSD